MSKKLPKDCYGYCPTCGSPGQERERCLDGHDYCENNHKYKSRDALKTRPSTAMWNMSKAASANRGAKR